MKSIPITQTSAPALFTAAAIAGSALILTAPAQAGFINWEVLNGSVDLAGPGWWDLQPGNGLYVDLDGTTSDAGMLLSRTEFLFEAGRQYQLQFELAGNLRNPLIDYAVVQVAMGSVFNKTFALRGDVGFQLITEVFSVSTTQLAKLSFEGLGGDRVGLLLDDIRFSVDGNLLLMDTFDTENGGRPSGNYGTVWEYDPFIYGDNPPNRPPSTRVPDGSSAAFLMILGLVGIGAASGWRLKTSRHEMETLQEEHTSAAPEGVAA
ncbi:MAG: hypothetical protein IT581_08860 [Verrucomicrobiales bacterium]|nr:hypothetical protein [Verrucomicrobiales bacterium]